MTKLILWGKIVVIASVVYMLISMLTKTIVSYNLFIHIEKN